MAVIYSQAEADDLISMPKWIDRDAWILDQGDGPWQSVRLAVLPESGDVERLSFWIEVGTNPATNEFKTTLHANLRPKGELRLARYEFGNGTHNNPPGFQPPKIKPRVIHRHLYNEKSIEKFRNWDKYATPLDLPNSGSFRQVRDRILFRFLADMNIVVRSAEVRSDLFGNHH